jgi:hypothetical protein
MKVMNIKWEIRYPAIVAHCLECRTDFLIEYVTLTSTIKHCGTMRTRLPEKVYESWLEAKDLFTSGKGKGKLFPSATPGEPTTAGDGNNPSSSKVPSRLDFNVKYF